METFNTKGFVNKFGVKFMVYGKPDSGKTHLISTLPKPLILAPELGVSTLRKFDFTVKTITNIADTKDITKWLGVEANLKQYDSVVLDSGSFLTYMLITELKRTKNYNHAMKYYGDMNDIALPLFERLINLNKNVLITAWEGDELNALGDVIGKKPDFAGKAVGSYLNHFFDMTMNLAWHIVNVPQADGTVVPTRMNYLQTCDVGNKIFARDRNNALAAFEPADLSGIIRKVQSLN